MALDVVVGFEGWRLRHALFEASGHVRLGMAERAVAVLQPVELSVADRKDVDTGSPRSTRLQLQLKVGAFEPNGKIFAEFDHGVTPKCIAPVSQGDLAWAEVSAQLSTFRAVVLDLEEVGEIAAILHLDRHRLRAVTVVLNGEVLVDTARHEAVAPDRNRRILADADARKGGKDRGRIVVDRPAGQDMQRVAVDEQPPGGELSHV